MSENAEANAAPEATPEPQTSQITQEDAKCPCWNTKAGYLGLAVAVIVLGALLFFKWFLGATG
jgi:hypothetical protein